MSKKKIRMLSIQEYDEELTNCFGFAFSIKTPVSKSESIYNLDHNFPISEAVLRKLDELGYDIKQLRQISSVDEALPSEYIIKVYGFKKKEVPHQFFKDFFMTTWDYHVVRRELNGIWVHKDGWEQPPSEIQNEEWPKLEAYFGKKHVLFALAAAE